MPPSSFFFWSEYFSIFKFKTRRGCLPPPLPARWEEGRWEVESFSLLRPCSAQKNCGPIFFVVRNVKLLVCGITVLPEFHNSTIRRIGAPWFRDSGMVNFGRAVGRAFFATLPLASGRMRSCGTGGWSEGLRWGGMEGAPPRHRRERAHHALRRSNNPPPHQPPPTI